MRHLKKKYETPIRPWDNQRIDAERELLNAFGLKSKRELWRTENLLRKYRRLARELIAQADTEKEKVIIDKLIRMGVLKEGAGKDDILSLSVNDLLERRLQTVLQRRGVANTVGHARQMIVHGKVKIGGRKVIYPSYIVTLSEERDISVSMTGGTKVKKAPEKSSLPDNKPEEKKVEENAEEAKGTDGAGSA